MSPCCLGLVADSDTVLAAFDAGINFFFVTADMHWPAYAPLRDGLARLLARGGGVRDRIVVAAVSYVGLPEFSTVPFADVVEAIPRLDRLDMLVAGGLYAQDLDRRLPPYFRHRENGYLGARALGGTFHDRAALVELATRGTLDLCFVRFNAAHPGAREDVFPKVAARKAPIFSFNCTHGHVRDERWAALGLDPETWQPDITDHYRFALSHDGVDGILCALDTPAQVEDLASALEQGPLDAEEQEHLVQLKVLELARRQG